MIDIKTQTIYGTVKVCFGDLFDRAKEDAFIIFREPKTRVLLSYQKGISRLVSSYSKELKDLTVEATANMNEEELLEYAKGKLDAVQAIQEFQYDWLFENFKDVYKESNLTEGSKDASVEAVRDFVYDKDALTARVIAEVAPLLTRK